MNEEKLFKIQVLFRKNKKAYPGVAWLQITNKRLV